MTIFMVDRSTGQIRELSLVEYMNILNYWGDTGYFVAYSRGGADCQQRAVFAEVARESTCARPEDVCKMVAR